MTLKELGIGQSAVIYSVGGEGALRQHFLDMGLIPGVEVTLVKYAPMGDPAEYLIHGYELTLRLEDAEKIEVAGIKKEDVNDGKFENRFSNLHFAKNAEKKAEKENGTILNIPHPGLGEGGKYHIKKNEHPLPENEVITFALVGNQNCGKTTLFNRLTGDSQHVGNFPGVTVDRKDGVIKGHPNTKITDLPGIYSISPYTNEEIVTRQFILNEKPKGIINIVDATNIERNLYLTMQLMELNIPMVAAFNMMDEVRENEGTIRINEMEQMLGIPVVPISAAKNEGIEELIDHALHVAKYQEMPERVDFCDAEDEKGGAVHRCIHSIMHLIEDHAKRAQIPLRFAASRLAEKDDRILEKLEMDEDECHMLGHIVSQMEKESGLDRAAAIANMRFSFIKRVCNQAVVKPKESKEHARSRKIDKFLTGRFTAIPAFIGIMLLIFYLTFEVIGACLSKWLELGISWVTGKLGIFLTQIHLNKALKSLIIDGIFEGVGSVLSFLPIIITLFFFLSMLEDSGYMARVAFVMDKLLRKIGLSGRSIVPMLIGFGCTVPGVMAGRTLSSERDRKMTILLTPFMSCSAKLPVYAFFTAAFFAGYKTLVMGGLYFLGILMGILMAMLLKGTIFKGEPVPFVMELPNYRMPGMKNVVRLLWEKAKDFLSRAFTVIFLATIVIWFLQNFDFRFNMTEDAGESILAGVAGLIAPVFTPLGFGDWRIITALITGFMAKESVVSTLSVLLAGAEEIYGILTPSAAVSLLVFCLLYTPCVAAVSAIHREMGRKWAAAVVVGQCVIAWIAAFAAALIAGAVMPA